MNLIPLELITPQQFYMIGVDAISLGGCFICTPKKGTTQKQLEELIKNIIIKELKETIEENYYIEYIDKKTNKLKKHYRSISPPNFTLNPIKDEHDNETGSYRLRVYVNHMNGTKKLKKYIIEKYYPQKEWGKMHKIPATDTQEKQNNFISIEMRFNPEVENDLPRLFEEKQAELLFEELEDIRVDLTLILERFKHEFEHLHFEFYNIGAIELNLDLPIPAGIDLVTDPEVVARLARHTLIDRRGKWVTSGKSRNVLIPIEVDDLAMKRCFKDYKVGTNCVYGQMTNKTEIYIATKQIPRIEEDQPQKIRDNWLTRIEWRFNRNHLLSSSQVQKQLEDITSYKKFNDIDEFKYAISDLKKPFYKYLRQAFNSKVHLWTQQTIPQAINLIQYYCPNPFVLNSLLSGGLRVNGHQFGIRTSAGDPGNDIFKRAVEAEIFIKTPFDNRHNKANQEYIFNFEKIWQYTFHQPKSIYPPPDLDNEVAIELNEDEPDFE